MPFVFFSPPFLDSKKIEASIRERADSLKQKHRGMIFHIFCSLQHPPKYRYFDFGKKSGKSKEKELGMMELKVAPPGMF